MTGVPADLSRRLRQVLPRCGPFRNDAELRDLFFEERIAPWRNVIQDSGSISGRVNALISLLYEQHNPLQENALVLFLEVLSEQLDAGDDCRQ